MTKPVLKSSEYWLIANLVELHYFNNHDKNFRQHYFSVKEPNSNQNIPGVTYDDLNNFVGDMDIFLLDLVLKGEIKSGKILDVGFGTGRNLIHFLQRKEFEVYGIETDESCLHLVRLMVSAFENQDAKRFHSSKASELTFDADSFQTIICARVFHFLNDQEKREAWKKITDVLAPGGVLYMTANSMVNFEEQSKPIAEGKHVFPDETTGYFLSRAQLDWMLLDPLFEKIEPVRNLQYDDEHAETILVLRKK